MIEMALKYCFCRKITKITQRLESLPPSVIRLSCISLFSMELKSANFFQKKVTFGSSYHQRWSRGHKARGQGQGHKKNPRPRTAFPRTDTLEAKDRNARGQGQEPRTQAQVLSKKKGFHKNFSSDPH